MALALALGLGLGLGSGLKQARRAAGEDEGDAAARCGVLGRDERQGDGDEGEGGDGA